MELHYILLAVTIGVAFHKSLEPRNVIRKLTTLDNALQGTTPPTSKFNITRIKAYLVGSLATLIASAAMLGPIYAWKPTLNQALITSIAVLLISEFLVIVQINDYHEKIDKLIASVCLTSNDDTKK